MSERCTAAAAAAMFPSAAAAAATVAIITGISDRILFNSDACSHHHGLVPFFTLMLDS